MLCAVTGAIRDGATATPGPTIIRLVRSAHSARCTYTSGYTMCESNKHVDSKPSASAIADHMGISGVAGETIPKRMGHLAQLYGSYRTYRTYSDQHLLGAQPLDVGPRISQQVPQHRLGIGPAHRGGAPYPARRARHRPRNAGMGAPADFRMLELDQIP